jgi:hypothetical protein
MTFPAVAQALSQGYSISKIIKSIMQMNSPLAKSIKEALRQGYSEDQIGEYLSKGKATSYSQKKSMLPGMTEEEKARGILYRQPASEKKLGGILKNAAIAAPVVAAGAMAAPAIGSALSTVAPTALSAAGSALARALPSSLTQIAGGLPGHTGGNNAHVNHPLPTASAPTSQMPQVTNQIQTSSQQPPVNPITNQTVPNITQTAEPVQPEVIYNPKEYLEKHGILDKVKALLKAGNSPEAVAAALGIKRSGEAKIDPELLKNIEEFTKLPEQEVSKLEKGSIAASPQGVGEIEAIRNGKAIINVNGKRHQFNEEELENEPTEIADLDLEEPVTEYLARIPEGQKSSVIDVSLYDPTTQELQVRFPNGDQWVYSDIPEEIFEKINSMTGIPVSSGESKLRGTIWETGVANSAGADFYKLIKKLVKEGKVKERKLKTGIDLFKGFTRVKKRK